MSSEKPFWEGKTCKEMAGLHIKVTFENGTVITGMTDNDGDIARNPYVSIDLSNIVGNANAMFKPCEDITSIELLDDPEYERIDNIENVHAGDIFVAKSGNRYDIRCVDPRRGRPVFRVSIEGEVREWIGSKSFAYALRLKLRLPDHDGLWWDKDNALWSVAISGLDNSKLVALLIGDPESPVTGSVWSGLNSKHVTSQAPFRPVKAVEA